MSRKYAMHSLSEARNYLDQPVLGPRLRQCAALVNAAAASDVSNILPSPGDLKFRSSMTLFAHAAEENGVFREALKRYFVGQEDQSTLGRIRWCCSTGRSHPRRLHSSHRVNTPDLPATVLAASDRVIWQLTPTLVATRSSSPRIRSGDSKAERGRVTTLSMSELSTRGRSRTANSSPVQWHAASAVP